MGNVYALPEPSVGLADGLVSRRGCEKSGIVAGTSGADCCCCGRTVVELVVERDIVPEGIWSDRDLWEARVDWECGNRVPGTEIWREGDVVSGTTWALRIRRSSLLREATQTR